MCSTSIGTFTADIFYFIFPSNFFFQIVPRLFLLVSPFFLLSQGLPQPQRRQLQPQQQQQQLVDFDDYEDDSNGQRRLAGRGRAVPQRAQQPEGELPSKKKEAVAILKQINE